MSSNEFKTECKPFKDRPGCGKEIVMKKDAEGKWHPYNGDGSPHKHLGKEASVLPLKQEVKNAIQAPDIERWVREIAQDECGKILAKHGIGFKGADS